MKLYSWYNFHFSLTPPSELSHKLDLEFPHGTVSIISYNSERSTADVRVSVKVNPDKLSIAQVKEALDGSPLEDEINVPEESVASTLVNSACRILAFVFHSQIHLTKSPGRDSLVPESDYDENVLNTLGSRQVALDIDMTVDVERSIVFRTLDRNILDKLIDRESGLALYLDAIVTQSPISKYRELWKVLESAFVAKGHKLTSLLSQYLPVSQIGFNRAELEEMLILRGRASHAESRSKLNEYNKIARETQDKVRRLKSLAEQLLITKKIWGSENLDSDQIADLTAFINKNGVLIILNKKEIN
jgi:hypothetical protein